MADQDMLINYVPGEECRIAIAEAGKLEELYTERASDELHVGNIYRGKITNVEPSIQAAFVDFGIGRHGFLHISDLHPRYFSGGDNTERVGKRTPRRDRPPIQQCLKRGQRILVQVLKEGIGTKGPTLTSYLSIPGRFLVMMPDMEHSGVSRKVEDEGQRREMRKILDELELPEGFGFIVRTAGLGRTKTELKRDLAYLMRLWKTIDRRLHQGKGPAELYRESDLIIRTLRDVLSNDIKRVIIDDINAARRARDFIRIAMPRGAAKVYYYDRPIPLFDAFDIEQQIAVINEREVHLPSGGSLVIDSTEAMVTIDVNSGKYRDKSDAEATVFHTNCEAVDEIARQLRLRDLGGVVCLDLIDMYQQKNRREVERRFKENLKKDRARSKTLKINELGLLSLTRQRMRPSLKRSLHDVCPTCDGASVVKTPESVVLDVMRQLAVVMSGDRVARIELTITPEVGAVLLNRKRTALHMLEQKLKKHVTVSFDSSLAPDDVQLVAYDERDATVDVEKLPRPKKPKFSSEDEVDAAEKRLGAELDEQADELEAWAVPDEESEEGQAEAEAGEQAPEGEREGEGSKKRRRRRRRRRKSDEAPAEAGEQPPAAEPGTAETSEPPTPSEAEIEREREAADRSETAVEQFEEEGTTDSQDVGDQPPRKKRRRRRGGRKHRRRREREAAETADQQQGEAGGEKTEPAKPTKADDGWSKPETADAQAAETEPQSPEAPTEATVEETPEEPETAAEPATVRAYQPGRDKTDEPAVDQAQPAEETTAEDSKPPTKKKTSRRRSSAGSSSSKSSSSGGQKKSRSTASKSKSNKAQASSTESNEGGKAE